MKPFAIIVLLSSFLLAACATPTLPTSDVPTLTITDGTNFKEYTTADLQELGQVQVEKDGNAYLGIPLGALLENSGYAPDQVISVQALSSDGFVATYDPVLIQKSDTILAYTLQDGPMGAEDGSFRMVIADQAGKLNPRMVIQLLVSHP